MPKLPETIEFDETAFPGLLHIFHDVDCAIAAIIASDPSFRTTKAAGRRSRHAQPEAKLAVRRGAARRVAA